MDPQALDKINDRLEKMVDRLGSIDRTLVRQEGQLAEHIRRTELLEDEVRPIKAHVSHVEGAAKLVALLALVAGILKAFRIL